MLKPLGMTLAATLLCGCSALGLTKPGAEYAAPVALDKESVWRAATPLASYDLVIVRADVADRWQVPGLQIVIESNLDYLLDHSASVIGLPLRVCSERARCPGRAAVVRFIEDGYQPYATQTVMMGARLQGYLVVTDAQDGRLLGSYRIQPAHDYRGVFAQIRGALGASLLASTGAKGEALDLTIAELNRIPAIKPDYEPVLLTGESDSFSWSEDEQLAKTARE